MKLKSLLYGTAAVLVSTGASTGAMAADLPVAAEPVEYVRVCDAFGKGFFYIPGTDTCLKISGRVRVRAFVRGGDGDDDNTDQYTSYARAYANFDARNETDLGLLRSYFSFRHTFGDRGTSTSGYDLSYGTANVVDEAFISLSNDMGQLTVGKTASFFDFFGGYTLTGNGGFDQTDDAVLFAYTFNIGNGVSTTLSLEDPYGSGRKSTEGENPNNLVVNFNAGLTDVDTAVDYGAGAIYGGQKIPDIVANLRVDQGWGSAQIMGVLRQITTKEELFWAIGPAATTTGTGTYAIAGVDDEWGWALGAGLEINIPGAPVSIAAQGGYADGACGYVAQSPAFLDDALFNYNTFVASGDGIETTECWQIGLGASIAASSTVSIDIDGAYGDIDHFGALYDYDYWGMAGAVTWKPVSGLAIAGEIQYSETNADLNSAGLSEISDDDSWQFTLSFQRDF